MKNKYLLVIIASLILIGIFYWQTQQQNKLPKCNPYWPQSYSDIPLELQPCPTPVLK